MVSLIQIKRMIQKTEILNKLKMGKSELKKFGVIRIGLFGSLVRNESKSDSDVDILIDMSLDTENIFDKRFQLKDALMQRFLKNVDVCHERAIKPVFKDLVFKDAIYAW